MPTIDGQWYGQDSPRDQLRVQLTSIRGHASNLKDGTIAPEKYLQYLYSDLERIDKLIARVQRLDTWPSDELL